MQPIQVFPDHISILIVQYYVLVQRSLWYGEKNSGHAVVQALIFLFQRNLSYLRSIPGEMNLRNSNKAVNSSSCQYRLCCFAMWQLEAVQLVTKTFASLRTSIWVIRLWMVRYTVMELCLFRVIRFWYGLFVSWIRWHYFMVNKRIDSMTAKCNGMRFIDNGRQVLSEVELESWKNRVSKMANMENGSSSGALGLLSVARRQSEPRKQFQRVKSYSSAIEMLPRLKRSTCYRLVSLHYSSSLSSIVAIHQGISTGKLLLWT